MLTIVRRAAFAIALGVALPVATRPAHAQQATVVADLMADIQQVREKLAALAKAMPENTYDWRPGPGVRSVREVFLHVASDNYLMPSAFGVAIDPSTGIKADDFKTLTTFEHQSLARDATLAAMEKSFDHLAKAMREVPSSRLPEKIKFFGQDFTGQRIWVMTATHLHEHLGQAIAYARSNKVVPPWSK